MTQSEQRAPHVLLLFDILLVASAWLLPMPEASKTGIFAVASLLVLWQVILFVFNRSSRQAFQFEQNIRKPHYVQTFLQLCLYGYWALYWEEVWRYLPLLFIQLLFAYLFEMLLAWSRQKVWRWGFGQFPVVLSINLFLWFRPEYFFFQFVLIALAYLGKEFVTWTYEGRKKHIFNPSAFPLALVSVGLLLTESWDATRAVDIIESFSLAPSFYEVVFLLSLVVQFLFGTTLVTLGAALSLCLLFAGGEVVMGAPLFPFALDRAVFLGISLLVTDPSTSPKTKFGKFLFGLLYGGGIFAACVAFHYLHQPAFFDKILMVPVVNLMVPWIDRVSAALIPTLRMTERPAFQRYDRVVWMGLYGALFFAVLPAHKAQTWFFQSPLPPSVGEASEALTQALFNRQVCQLEYPTVYEPFGFTSEFSHYSVVVEMLHMEPSVAEARLLQYLEEPADN